MSFEIDVQPDVMYITLSGSLTGEDLKEMILAIERIEGDRDPVPHRITDVTGVTAVSIGYPEVRAFALHRRTQQFRNPFKSAIVVGSTVQRGMARMFQTLNDSPWITIEIFNDQASARAWLAAPGGVMPGTQEER